MATFRHELKYYINYPDYHLLKMRVRDVLTPDKHAGPEGDYTIRSLYFDDYSASAYTEKYQGTPLRKKYRIRIYNYSDSVINLECKIKSDRYIYKISAPLTREETDQIMDGDVGFLKQKPADLYTVFYHEYVSKLLRPRVIVDYEREAYTMDAGTVRVTFDKNVRAGVEALDLFNPDLATAEVVPPSRLVMEVKFTEFYPRIVKEVLTGISVEYLAISKYILCCDKTLYKHTVHENTI